MNKEVSKKLSYLLRHKKGFTDEKGWASVELLLNMFLININDLDDIVTNNDKKRFSYNDDKTLIRANQGHSVNVNVDLEVKVPPIILYHGTAPNVVNIILKDGLKKMSRQYVHLSIDKKTAINVGKRHSKKLDPIILEIDCKSMVNDGYNFYISVNNVWLSDDIPPQYIKIS